MIGRAFFETAEGGKEYAYIPDDLRLNLPGSELSLKEPPGRAARPEEYAHIYPATVRILDDACTLLAALRMGLPEDEIPISNYPGKFQPSVGMLSSLLQAAHLLDESCAPIPEAAQQFLESERGIALSQLVKSWLNSKALNELGQLPQLVLEGEWKNDPIRTRKAIMELLSGIPSGKWWGLEAFVGGVREQNPDYQRPAGDYDSWIIRQAGSETYLSGFDSWDQVDGQLLRLILTGFLHWLGVLELAAPDKEKDVTAFRFSAWSGALLEGKAPDDISRAGKKVILRSDGRLVVSRQVQLSVRYQAARFCEWGDLKHGDYIYRITPGSLGRAEQKGLQPNQLLSLLEKHAEHVPPNIVTALERFERNGRQARMEQVLVLRVSSPDILEELRASRAVRFLGDPLGPTTVIVIPGAKEKVLSALVEMGYLGEVLDE